MSNIKQYREQLLKYTNGMILPSKKLMSLPSEIKLVICQITPEKAIKQFDGRNYVPVGYIERCLNFISNFKRGCKVQREGFTEYPHKKKNGDIVTTYDAWVLADFYIEIGDKRIERSCYGAWKMYKNPNSSIYTCIEAARSMATKSFADTLGVASDKLTKEFDEIRESIESDIVTIDDAVDGFIPTKEKNE